MENINQNILSLRRYLKLNQSEFLSRFLSNESGTDLMSVSKFSNFENRGGKDASHIAEIVAQQLKIDANVFYMEPDYFAKNIELFLEKYIKEEQKLIGSRDITVKMENPVEVLVRVISDYLSDCILSGELYPGSKLPSDRNLALHFGVGRTVLREALKVLSVLGLIDIRPGLGTFIAKDSTHFFVAPLSWSFFMGEQNINHVIRVRNVLEVESALLAAQNMGVKGCENLKAVYSRSSTAYEQCDFQNFLNLDLDFHIAIATCSENPIIQSLLLTSRKLILRVSKTGMVNLQQLQDIHQEHTEIYNAIISGDSAASAGKMRAHLNNSFKRYKINK